MEDGGIGGLLFVVVAMILSFVSSSKKRQKMSGRDIEPDEQEQEQERGLSPFDRASDEDNRKPYERSLEDIFGELFPVSKVNVPQNQPTVKTREDKVVLPKATSKQPIATALPQEGGRITVQSLSQDDEADMFLSEYSDSVDGDCSDTVNTNRTGVDVKKLIDNFDIGKAVVYSEILSPKYKEY